MRPKDTSNVRQWRRGNPEGVKASSQWPTSGAYRQGFPCDFDGAVVVSFTWVIAHNGLKLASYQPLPTPPATQNACASAPGRRKSSVAGNSGFSSTEGTNMEPGVWPKAKKRALRRASASLEFTGNVP